MRCSASTRPPLKAVPASTPWPRSAGSGREIADCQNIAAMIVDPDGKGLKDYWRQEGWSWLSVVILHVIHRTGKEHNRCASLADVNLFAAETDGEEGRQGEDGFDTLLDQDDRL